MKEGNMQQTSKASFPGFAKESEKAAVFLPLATQLIHPQNQGMREAGVEIRRQVVVHGFAGQIQIVVDSGSMGGGRVQG
jgi:hypothetical protein